MTLVQAENVVQSTNTRLVIGRLTGEALIIGGGIRVQVLRDDSGLIRLRIEAPREVNIVREELVVGKKLDISELYYSLEEVLKKEGKLPSPTLLS